MRYGAFVLVLLFSSIVRAAEIPYFQHYESSIAYHASTIAVALLHNTAYETSLSSYPLPSEQNGNYYNHVEWQEMVPGPVYPAYSNNDSSRHETLISSSMPSRISRSYKSLYDNGFPTEAFFEALEDENSDLQHWSRIMLQRAAEKQRIFRYTQ